MAKQWSTLLSDPQMSRLYSVTDFVEPGFKDQVKYVALLMDSGAPVPHQIIDLAVSTSSSLLSVGRVDVSSVRKHGTC
jgi:hypothetical protein